MPTTFSTGQSAMVQKISQATARAQLHHQTTGLSQQNQRNSAAYASADSSAGSMADKKNRTILTLPTMLTLSRVVAVPVLIAAFFWQSQSSTLVCTLLFVGAALTDWLDGWLARKMQLHSEFGAFLDPVADKLMVAASLIVLCSSPIPAGVLAGNQWFLPLMSFVIIGREITMSALREWAAKLGGQAAKAVAVNNLGKYKTACQMAAITLLLAVQDTNVLESYTNVGADIGVVALGVASGLTVLSLSVYFKGLWKHL